MPAGGEPRRPSPDSQGDGPTFALERFEWGAPDRLELTGTFFGIADAQAAEPLLVVRGQDETHQLPAVQNGEGPPADGTPWAAAFAWLEAPVAFDHARLELGAVLAVELPGPGEAETGRSLPVEQHHEGNAAGAASDAEGAAGRLRLEAQLLEAQQQLEEARVAARRAQDELDRAHADLAGERERAAADAARFREGLATVRASAEEALGAAALARSQADEQARTEIATLREHVAALEPAAAEVEAIRSELDLSRNALAEARSGAQDLLDRLAGHTVPPAEGR